MLAVSTYGKALIPAIVGRGNLMGCQFHPEKSGKIGGLIMRAFVEMCVRGDGA
jgi:glutamine amidotransferase